MAYETENNVGSPRLHLLNILKENKIYSEFPKDNFTKIIDDSGYYFSEELLEKNFDLENCIRGKTSWAFMIETGYSRPKINAYIEKHGRIVYLAPGYYDLQAFTEFLKTHIKEHIEKRGRPCKEDSEIISNHVWTETTETVWVAIQETETKSDTWAE